MESKLNKQKKNFLVMAGTRDAAKIIEKLKNNGNYNILATTTTEYGAEIARNSGADEVLSGQMDLTDLKKIISRRKIDTLIDATHPFAINATKNAIKASEITGIEYIRFERPTEDLIEDPSIIKVFSFEEAALRVSKLRGKGKILHIAGVSTLPPITKKVDVNRIFARVLPSIDSIQKCLDLGLKQENIIAMQGTFSKNFNKTLMEEYDISLIITKDSGKTGGTSSKITAAIELGIISIIILRPEVLELKNQIVLNDLDDLLDFLKVN